MSEVEADKPEFAQVPGKSRIKVVELDWPVIFKGKTYNQITVRRGTMAEWRAVFESEADSNAAMMAFFDAPPQVVNHLDPVDDAKVKEAVESFFPQHLRAQEEKPSESGSPTGDQ